MWKQQTAVASKQGSRHCDRTTVVFTVHNRGVVLKWYGKLLDIGEPERIRFAYVVVSVGM